MKTATFLPVLTLIPFFAACLFAQSTGTPSVGDPWNGYAHDPQHTAVSLNRSQSLTTVHWSTPVDQNPPRGELLIHYGSPSVTAGNNVLVPVRTTGGGFEVQAFNGTTGAPIYTLSTTYTQPSHDWIPPYGPVLILNRLYYPGPGGTVYYRDNVDSATGSSGQIAFFGDSLYAANAAAFNGTVQISTPLSADRDGNIFFGFIVSGANPANLTSGIARISAGGAGRWLSAPSTAGGDASITQVALNCTPALSNDQRTLYFAVSDGAEYGNGYLVSVDSATLTPIAHVQLYDPRGSRATISSDSSASPMIGPDGDVYYGVLETPCCSSHNDRGWMLHFNSALTETKIPGSFGWDDTASVVASNLVPSYSGSSPYLILTKYNNYAGVGTGTGVNQVAVLDPNTSMQDEYSSTPVQVMTEVLAIDGVTPAPQPGYPNAVREWCINTAVIDPFTKSAIVNSEDGVVYRWSFVSNTFTQRLTLTSGISEAYTPTLIGVDGTVYAINDAVLFAVGN